MAVTNLFLIRHAQSHPADNVPDMDWPLSDLGHDQAVELAKILPDLDLDAIFCSPYRRCIDTIAPFARDGGVEVTTVPDLRERRVAETVIPDFLSVWKQSWADMHFKLPGCESSFEAQTRFLRALRQICAGNADRRLGVSTHGNVIGLALRHIDPEFGVEQANTIRNPDIFELRCESGELTWNRDFVPPAHLDKIATHFLDTPVRFETARSQ